MGNTTKEPIILEFIPFGEENAISRRELAGLVHMTDRETRAAIAEASTAKHPVVSTTKGYFRPTADDLDAVAGIIKREGARARSIIKRQKDLKKYLETMRGEVG